MGQIVTPSNAGFSPREIRRQDFQEAVAATLDRQAHAITATREFMADLSVRLDDLHAQVTAAKADIVALAADHAVQKQAVQEMGARLQSMAHLISANFDVSQSSLRRDTEVLHRGLLGRLRWLLTGK